MEPGLHDGLPDLGKLGVKMEPAGKVRVFAMVDTVRQRLLKPFHEWLMEILRELPTDGTFEQVRPVRRLLSKHHIDRFWCFDLSSATDRMPFGVYFRFWSDIFGSELSRLWCILMCRHRFAVPSQIFGIYRTSIAEARFSPTGSPLVPCRRGQPFLWCTISSSSGVLGEHE